jgi:signal transduction histidine kinase
MRLREGFRRIRTLLPEGGSLPEELWARRHRWMVVLLFAHAVGIMVFAFARGYSLGHSFQEGSVVAAIAGLAMLPKNRKLRSALGALGLITSSAVLVHISGGSIEMHFHFFIALGLLTLYEDWFPFLLALGYVVVHHGTMGIVDPSSVYNHPAALNNPWKWAAIHGFFVTAASISLIVSWRVSEIERARAEEFRGQLHDAQLRRQQAMQINDGIVQGLTVAQLALDLERPDDSRQALNETLVKAREIISSLLGEMDTESQVSPGELVRARPALLRESR